FFVGSYAKDPLVLRALRGIIPLLAITRPLAEVKSGAMFSSQFFRAISAAGIHDHNFVYYPRQRRQRARQIMLFIISNQASRDAVHERAAPTVLRLPIPDKRGKRSCPTIFHAKN